MVSVKTSNSNQSLIRGLSLLEILSDYPNGCSLAKLSELAKLNKSTTHRMLQALQSCDYIKPANSFGSYRLTTKCLGIGRKTLSSLNILGISSPYLEQLNLETGETVNLSMFDGEYATIIHKLEPTIGMMRTRAYIGQRLKLYCSAMGKIFIAYNKIKLSDYWNKYQNEITQFTSKTIITIEKMELELKNILKQGFAVDNEENELGVTCLAYPIFDHDNKVIYSISISLSTARLEQIDRNILVDKLSQTANSISQELGSTII